MSLKESWIDEEERFVIRERNGDCPEMSHVSRINIERTSRWIHSCYHLSIDDIFECEFSNIIPMLIICMLSKQSNSTLSVIGIELRHVKVINEIDKFLFSWWTKLFSCNFLQKLLKLDLQIAGISVIWEVNELIVEILRQFLHYCPQTSFG